MFINNNRNNSVHIFTVNSVERISIVFVNASGRRYLGNASDYASTDAIDVFKTITSFYFFRLAIILILRVQKQKYGRRIFRLWTELVKNVSHLVKNRFNWFTVEWNDFPIEVKSNIDVYLREFTGELSTRSDEILASVRHNVSLQGCIVGRNRNKISKTIGHPRQYVYITLFRISNQNNSRYHYILNQLKTVTHMNRKRNNSQQCVD